VVDRAGRSHAVERTHEATGAAAVTRTSHSADTVDTRPAVPVSPPGARRVVLRLRYSGCVNDPAARTHLKHLWSATIPISAALAVGGRTFLQGHGIPAKTAVAARVRFAHLWGDEDDYQGGAVVFPLQDASGKLVAAEGYYMTPPRDVARTYSAGTKALGVFEALPDAMDAETVVITESPLSALAVAAGGYPALALCGITLPEWLPRRLAGRDVLVSLDWHELAAESKAALIFRTLAAAGARTHRLVPPSGRDWNDHLKAVGVEAMRAELDRTITSALPGG
jgi:hypothetical protein